MKLLAIGAHIDDVEIGCGGTLAEANRHGWNIYILVLSPSDYSGLGGDMLRTSAQALQEGRQAVQKLGGAELEILDFPTLDIPYNRASVGAIESYLRQIQPDVILTHWPHDTHQDHRATSLASISAARYFNSILFYEPMTPSGRSYAPFRPQVYVAVPPEAVQAKRDSLLAHDSQYKKYGDIWLDAVIARGVHRGYEIGVGHAECYETLRWQWSLDLR
ncbi:MAG: PIG-L deacetylase family protein [Anaerolineales bacterium]